MLAFLRRGFWLFGIALLLLLLFLPGYTKLQELRERNRDLVGKIRQLSIENSMLEQEIHRLESDPLYQEKVARDKMGVVRKGEIPIRIVPLETKKGTKSR